MQVFCSALPNEKERCHGIERAFCACMALRLIVAVSSLSSSRAVSPERKKMPGIAAGTVRRSAVTVAIATSSAGAFGPVRPFFTMLGLRTAPSR